MDLINDYEAIGGMRAVYHGDGTVLNEKLETELARLLFKQAPYVSISLYFLLVIVLYFFWNTLPHPLLIIWSIVNFGFATALLVLARRYHFDTGRRASSQWIKRYTVLAFLQDISWGMIGPLSFLADNDVYRMLTLFMLAGMAAGAIATRAVVFNTYVVTIFSLLSPILIAMAIAHDEVSGGMLALTVVYLLFMLSVAKNYSRSIRSNVLLWLDNEQLISDLVESKKEIEDANSILVNEIDNRLKVEEELVLAKERAERASAAKNQFLANVSHELRTPLNGIIGFNAILKKAELDSENKLYVSQIEKSAHTLLKMVNDILDITSIEAGHLKLSERPFSLRAEIDDVMAVADTLAARKSLKLDYQVGKDVPDVLLGDPDRLKQVLHNIVGNAIKYTDQGRVSVRVKSLSRSDDKVKIELEVEDSGAGIPEAVRPILFENFTQGESFDDKKRDGVGLGLAIVKNLLDKMGGSIGFDTVEGSGTRFRIALPFRLHTGTAVLPAAMQTAEKPAGYRSGHAFKAQRVLVVDDNDVNRMVLASFLKQLGIDHEEASSGKLALEKIEAGGFDVALLDIQMPGVSGLDVASSVARMEGPRPSLVAVTAHAFPQQREEILKAGFIECLIKPVAEADLVRILNQVCGCVSGPGL